MFSMHMTKISTFDCIILTGFVFPGIGLTAIFFHVAPNKKNPPLMRETGFWLRHKPSAKEWYLSFVGMLWVSLFHN